jgi:hypothetical protein
MNPLSEYSNRASSDIKRWEIKQKISPPLEALQVHFLPDRQNHPNFFMLQEKYFINKGITF